MLIVFHMWRKSLHHERLHYVEDGQPICKASWHGGSIPPEGYETKCCQCQRRLRGEAQGAAWPKGAKSPPPRLGMGYRIPFGAAGLRSA